MNIENLLNTSFTSFSPEETQGYAHKLASLLKSPSIIYLNGQLGSGKTLICKSIGDYFNVSNINSSSFQRITISKGNLNIIHCDFYRDTPNEQFFEEEVLPLLMPPWILLVEWGYNYFEELECDKFNLNIICGSGTERKISVDRAN